MELFQKARVDRGARSLPGRAYTCPDRFAEEREHIFYRSWYLIARVEAVSEPGSYLLATVGNENLIIVRDESDQLHAFYNVCRHRGAVLCEQPRGKLGGSIVCPYHGWAYGLDGKLRNTRALRPLEGFDPEDHPLHTAHLSVWNGFLFLNLAPDPDPIDLSLGSLSSRVAPWNMSTLRQGGRIEYEVKANWKHLFQNYSECYHCPLVHPRLAALSPWDSGRNDLMEGPILGGFMELKEETMSADGRRRRPTLPLLPEQEHCRVYYYSIMPNAFLSLHPDYVMAHTLHPRAPDRTHITCQWLFQPEALTAESFDPSDVISFWDEINRQDWHVCELAQRGVASRAYQPGPYSNSEGLLWAFDRHYLSLLPSPALSPRFSPH